MEIPKEMIDAAGEAIRKYVDCSEEVAAITLEAADIPTLLAENGRLKAQIRNPSVVCEVCWTSAFEPCEPSEKWPKGLACVTCEQRARIAELEVAALTYLKAEEIYHAAHIKGEAGISICQKAAEAEEALAKVLGYELSARGGARG